MCKIYKNSPLFSFQLLQSLALCHCLKVLHKFLMKPCIGKDNKYNPQKPIILQTFLVSQFISKIKEIVVLSHILFLFYYWCGPRMVFSFLGGVGIHSLLRLPPSEIQMLRLKAKFKNNRLAYLFSICVVHV
jgi:hypothetical protein